MEQFDTTDLVGKTEFLRGFFTLFMRDDFVLIVEDRWLMDEVFCDDDEREICTTLFDCFLIFEEEW